MDGILAENKCITRDSSLDAAKGILIILVVYAHCFTSGILHDFIFSFHMPAFFLISGITGAISCEADKPYYKTATKLLRTIGVPFLFFEFLGVISEIIRSGFSQSLKGFVFNTVTLRCNNIVDWFLGTLLFAKLISVLFFKLSRRITRTKYADVIYISISVLFMIIAVLLPKEMPFVVKVWRRILVANGFIAIGYTFEQLIRKKKIFIGVISLLATLIVSIINTDYMDINELQFDYPVFFFVAAFLGSYGVIQIGKLCCWKPLIWIGNNSIIIMGTHIPILLLLRHFLGIVEPTILQRICNMVAILLLEIPIILIVRNYVPFFIGQKIRRKI